MADPVSLALGIAPLVLSAVKGFKAVRSRFKILRNHDRVLRRLRRSFITQSHVFLDECHLLLQQVADPDDVVFMLEDEQSELWSDRNLDNRLKKHLGRKFEDVKEIIEEIHNQIKSLNERLNRTLEGAARDVRLSATEKVREAFDVMSNKTEYETDIDHLKELNQEFKRLRKMANEIKSVQTLAKSQDQNQTPKEYKIRGEYARSFYNALRYCWSCTELEHVEHNMALVLDWADAYDMHIILHCSRGNNSSFKTNTVDLAVQPQGLPLSGTARTISYVNSSSMIPDTQARPMKRTRLGHGEWSRKPPSPPEYTYQETLVGSLDESTDAPFGTVDLCQQSAMLMEVNCVKKPREPIDLRRSYNVCGTLLGLEDPKSTPECFIDTPDSIRHALAVRSTVYSVDSGFNSRRTATPLLNILKRSLDADLCVTQQLRLVLQLAKGHLQLHWTPWWRQYWSLSDLSYFTEESALGTADLDNCLKTLHIGTRLDFETLNFDSSAFHLTPEVETALLTHGIRNLSLYCLGIALLQIGRWDPLVDATDDVVVVRKLAARNGRLGPRYQTLTQKCIECDFGEGSDLGNPQLQGIIYKSVVCELESLVEVLEKT
ncbi:hypothetical protein FHL15_010089 [Xylaria flabelliformis]|uniref:Uncharacterized protein n=1 Tax=Xylaria flabelliformis TaxID=2512241 RepID=A0A553HM82_9PEZI|nr:hypothetical protein FHL15_010089 [Xylaria flabelliformis]